MKKLITLLFLVVSFAATPIMAQFTGTYYVGIAGTRPSGGDPDYLTLKSAVDAINAGTITGDCTFYFTSDLTEAVNVGLAVNTAGFTLTFKPYTAIQPTITYTQATDNLGTSGAWVIGVTTASGAALIPTNNIVVDGSNTVGGTTRDLKIISSSGVNGYPFRVRGDCDNITIKNCEMTAGLSTIAYGIWINPVFTTPNNYVPDNVTIDNCLITTTTAATGTPLHIARSGTTTLAMENLVIKNNNLVGRHRGVFLQSLTNVTTIEGNTFEINQTATGMLSSAIEGSSIFATGTTNVIGNNFKQNATANVTAGAYGIRTIVASGGGTWKVVNNFFSGYAAPFVDSKTTEIIGLRCGSAVEAYFNTFVMNGIDATTGSLYRAISVAAGTPKIKNNIIITLEDDFANYCIAGTPGESNNNNFYRAGSTNANIGLFSGVGQATLTDWQTASLQDANSTSKDVTFTSATDFHLAGTSLSDGDLMGVPIAGITTDIDGNLRDAFAPYKGADEGLRGMKGDFYVGVAASGPAGTDPHFASLKEATDYINDANILGDVNFYITSDITELYTGSVGIGLAVNPDPYTVTFKPYIGVQPVITFNYPTDLNSGPSGAFVIGTTGKSNNAWASLKTTKNIIIDGSNTIGGSTRDLTLQSATTAQRNALPLVVVGDVSNLTVKNCNIFYKVQTVSTSGNLLVSTVMIRSTNQSATDWVPRNLTFDNNHISSNFTGVPQNAQGIGYYQSSTPVPATFPNNITIKNNLIEGTRRSISLYQAGSTDIFNNEVILNQNIAAGVASEAIYAVGVMAGSVVNIYNNKISKVSSMSNGAAYGVTGISIESNGTYNVYNNMITGFELTAVNPTAYLTGIKNSSATDTLNCNFNTIFMNDIADIGTGVVTYKGLSISDGLNTVKNNLVFSAEANFASYCFSREGALGTLTSNYNDLFAQDNTNGNVGYWNTAATKTIADWKTASEQDANSKSVTVNFTSLTDLHLTDASDGDVNLIGTPIASVLSDIDGDTRSVTFPYIGADEANTPLPVELTSFAVSSKGNIIELNWQTATEKNSSYFEIQRKSEKSNWASVGKVNASGTTTERVKYSFTEKDVKGTVVFYRLKIVDLDGSYSYSKEVEVKVDVPVNFELSQNYPNPFNPSTTIKYAIPVDSKVRIDIYSTLGELVTTLVNDLQTAGNYSIAFDASRFASGTYIYRLTANSTVITKKMLLIK